MMRWNTVIPLTCILLLASGCAARKYHLTAAPSVPAASGQVEVGRDSNGNTKIELTVRNLAKPSNLTPAKSNYVVWIQPNGSAAVNQGQLTVNDNLTAKFKTVTPERNFDLFITAENDVRATQPAGVEVLRARIQQ